MLWAIACSAPVRIHTIEFCHLFLISRELSINCYHRSGVNRSTLGEATTLGEAATEIDPRGFNLSTFDWPETDGLDIGELATDFRSKSKQCKHHKHNRHVSPAHGPRAGRTSPSCSPRPPSTVGTDTRPSACAFAKLDRAHDLVHRETVLVLSLIHI
eukprot:1786847-Rhodomonas_salina.1